MFSFLFYYKILINSISYNNILIKKAKKANIKIMLTFDFYISMAVREGFELVRFVAILNKKWNSKCFRKLKEKRFSHFLF